MASAMLRVTFHSGLLSKQSFFDELTNVPGMAQQNCLLLEVGRSKPAMLDGSASRVLIIMQVLLGTAYQFVSAISGVLILA